MKRFFMLVVMVSFASPAFAGTWCEWTGTTTVNCQSDSKGYVRRSDGLPIGGGGENYNANGLYELITTEPQIGANQVKDAEVLEFVDNTITRTWTVRDLTAAEIDNRVASPLSVNDYWQWRAIQLAGGWTDAQMLTRLPADIVEAFKARKRLLGD